MFKTQVWLMVNPCNVLNILWCYFMVTKSTDHRKLPSIFFYNYNEKEQEELALFSVEKVNTIHLTSFLLSVLL